MHNLIKIKNFDTWLDEIFQPLDCYSWAKDTDFPKISEVTKEDKHYIYFALAGYSKEQLKIISDSLSLTVSADKKEDSIKTGFAARAFRRVFTDPSGTWDFTKVSAKYENGMLELAIPKKEALKQVVVNIQ